MPKGVDDNQDVPDRPDSSEGHEPAGDGEHDAPQTPPERADDAGPPYNTPDYDTRGELAQGVLFGIAAVLVLDKPNGGFAASEAVDRDGAMAEGKLGRERDVREGIPVGGPAELEFVHSPTFNALHIVPHCAGPKLPGRLSADDRRQPL